MVQNAIAWIIIFKPNFGKSSNDLNQQDSFEQWFLPKYYLRINKQSISNQSSHFIPPENTRKPKVFWCFMGYEIETLARNWFKTLLEKIFGSRYSRVDQVKFVEDSL